MRKQEKDFHVYWTNCQKCPLGKKAFAHVLFEQSNDSDFVDVFFIGEAPGHSENVIGRPFIGRSGKLLRGMIDYTHRKLEYKYVYLITNVLACIPTEESKIRPPSNSEIDACNPRLVELMGMRKPTTVILMGRTAQSLVETPFGEIIAKKGIPVLEMYHPAYWARRGSENSMEYKRDRLRLLDFLDQHLSIN